MLVSSLFFFSPRRKHRFAIFLQLCCGEHRLYDVHQTRTPRALGNHDAPPWNTVGTASNDIYRRMDIQSSFVNFRENFHVSNISIVRSLLAVYFYALTLELYTWNLHRRNDCNSVYNKKNTSFVFVYFTKNSPVCFLSCRKFVRFTDRAKFTQIYKICIKKKNYETPASFRLFNWSFIHIEVEVESQTVCCIFFFLFLLLPLLNFWND